MRACLVRHGETSWSLSGRHTGTTELGLTAHGQAQSDALAPRLRGIDFTQVWVSPRLRARQTCARAGFAGASQVEPDLCEWDYGEYEGRRSAEIAQNRADWDIWRDGCPGGESPAAVSARADRLIARLASVPGTVALFSHGQFGAALAARWIGLAVAEGRHFALQTASVSLLGVDPHRPQRRVIESWNGLLAEPLPVVAAPACTSTSTPGADPVASPKGAATSRPGCIPDPSHT